VTAAVATYHCCCLANLSFSATLDSSATILRLIPMSQHHLLILALKFGGIEQAFGAPRGSIRRAPPDLADRVLRAQSDGFKPPEQVV
jgi:hypothetical protein